MFLDPTTATLLFVSALFCAATPHPARKPTSLSHLIIPLSPLVPFHYPYHPSSSQSNPLCSQKPRHNHSTRPQTFPHRDHLLKLPPPAPSRGYPCHYRLHHRPGPRSRSRGADIASLPIYRRGGRVAIVVEDKSEVHVGDVGSLAAACGENAVGEGVQ